MAPKKIVRCLLPLLLASPVSVTAAQQRFECPESLAADAVRLSAAPGWTAFVDGPVLLSAVGMTAGPPQSMAALRGETKNRKGEPVATTYRLVDGFPEGKWLDCRYGDGGELQISKRIDDRFRRCIVTEVKARTRGRRNFDIVCDEVE